MAADSREVMNIRQASQYLGVSPDTLYKYVAERKIRLQAGQPLALQEIEAGPVDGREVEHDEMAEPRGSRKRPRQPER